MDANDEAKIRDLIKDYLKGYDPTKSINEWNSLNNAFKKVWQNKVLNDNYPELSEFDDIQPVIRILDKHGRRKYEVTSEIDGNNIKERLDNIANELGIIHEYDIQNNFIKIINMDAVANCMIPQKKWNKLFNDLKKDLKLKNKLNYLFLEKNTEDKINLINELKVINDKNGYNLIKPKGVALNAILVAYDFELYPSIVSLKDRIEIVDFFNLQNLSKEDFNSMNYGEKIIKTNTALLDFKNKFDLNIDTNTLSKLLYQDPIRNIWRKEEKKITPPKKPKIEPGKGIESKFEIEDIPKKIEIVDEGIDNHTKIQWHLIQLGKLKKYDVWVALNDKNKTYGNEKFNDITVNDLPLHGFKDDEGKIIKNIDVIWLKNDQISHLFEIEFTTSIYSGILRMSDLITLQPYLPIKLYIVAPETRRNEAIRIMNRPSFKHLYKSKRTFEFLSFEDVKNDYESSKRIKII